MPTDPTPTVTREHREAAFSAVHGIRYRVGVSAYWDRWFDDGVWRLVPGDAADNSGAVHRVAALLASLATAPAADASDSPAAPTDADLVSMYGLSVAAAENSGRERDMSHAASVGMAVRTRLATLRADLTERTYERDEATERATMIGKLLEASSTQALARLNRDLDSALALAAAAERERDEARTERDFYRADSCQMQASRDAAIRESDRWRHGVPIEGDYVCPDSLRADAAEKRAAEAEAKAAQYIADWTAAKAEFGTAMGKLRESLRAVQGERHDLANRFAHAACSLEVIARDLGIKYAEVGSVGWSNPIWEGVRARKEALSRPASVEAAVVDAADRMAECLRGIIRQWVRGGIDYHDAAAMKDDPIAALAAYDALRSRPQPAATEPKEGGK